MPVLKKLKIPNQEIKEEEKIQKFLKFLKFHQCQLEIKMNIANWKI